MLTFPISMASIFLVNLAILEFTSSSSLSRYKPPLELAIGLGFSVPSVLSHDCAFSARRSK